MEDLFLKQGKTVFKVAAWATITMVIIIPIQILIFVLTPHPTSVMEWLELFKLNPFLGIMHLDGLYIINNVIIAIIYLALFILMYKEQPTKMILAVLLGFLGISSYFSSNKVVEMYFLSKEYWSISPVLPKELYLASVQTLLLAWKGTAFDIYYILNGIALFLISFSILNSKIFKKHVAIICLISAILMIIPSNFGTVGLVFALLSLIPWTIFCIMIIKVFFSYSKSNNRN